MILTFLTAFAALAFGGNPTVGGTFASRPSSLVGDGAQGVTGIADPGVPKIYWAGPRTIQILGFNMMLNGFKAGGQYSKPGGAVKPFDNKAYRYDDSIEGFTLPNLSSGATEMWVAIFATAGANDAKAGIHFTPFLKVDSYDSSSGVVTFDGRVGTFTPDFFKGGDVLICQEGGNFSFNAVTATGNGANTITLPRGLRLAAGDYLLPAPMGAGGKLEYKYLRSLKMDFSPTIAGNASEWRNFAFSGNATHSYTGTPHKEIFNGLGNYHVGSKWRELDFRDFVSPLATGVIGFSLIRRTAHSSAIGDAALFIATDSSYHIQAELAALRMPANGGTVAQFEAAFDHKQSLWVGVNGAVDGPTSVGDSDVVGNFTIVGWTEG